MMDNLKMHTPNLADENYKKLAALFPNAVTETVDENGEVVRAIDADVLRQEISATVVEGPQERYQFTWPDKKKSVVLANQPIAKTLRLDREKSVGRDGTPGSIDTENIYIEGDNLDALKLLQETYLGKVKMIYIDPPYNTGSDAFVYDDDSSISGEEFSERSGQYDEDGNMLFDVRTNNEANGRFHTDWLNMLYSRLRIAKDLLSDDGVLFISIDDNEVENLTKIGKEIFGEGNYVNALKWKRKKQPSFLSRHIAPVIEYVLIFAKNSEKLGKLSVESISDSTKKVINISNAEAERVFKAGVEVKGIENGIISKGKYTVKTMTVEYLDDVIVKNYHTVSPVVVRAKFLNTQDKIDEFIDNHLLYITAAKGLRRYVSSEEVNKEKSITDLLLDWGDNQDSEKEQKDIFGQKYFDYTKPVRLIYNLIKSCTYNDSIIFDFFSGSATTAHAAMQLNAEDGGHRKFIMVQLPEVCNGKSEAYKAGYKNICEIGEERIRRAGRKILELSKESLGCLFEEMVKEGVIEKYAGELSEVRSLEEIYGSCGADLSLDKEIAKRGNVRSVGSAASSSRIDSVKHSRRASQRNQGIYLFFESGKGLKSRNGNTIVDMRTLGLLNENGYRICDELVGGNQQNDIFADEKSYDENLESKLLSLSSKFQALNSAPDVGFRVFRVDSSNMKDVYYTPAKYKQEQMEMFADNIKEDRTPEDLLFQVMLDLGIMLSSDIEETEIAGKRVFSVAGGYLIACFDSEVTDETVTEIAKQHPFYAVFRDSGMANDSVMTNFEQIFETYSPRTQRKVL